MRYICNDKTVRSDTIQDLMDFNSQSLATQAKHGKQLVSMMPAIEKAFILMGDDIMELSTGNETLKKQIGDYDQEWLEESKAKLLKQIDNDKKANFINSKMKNRWKNSK